MKAATGAGKDTAAWLVLPDIHLPYEDKRSLKAVKEFAKAREWRGLICLGDLLDVDVLSKFSKENLRGIEGRTLSRDYDAAESFWQEWMEATGTGKKDRPAFWIEGNHEERIERFIDSRPEFRGVLEIPRAVPSVKAGKVKWVPYARKGEVLHVGEKATFIHGIYCNDHHAKTHVTTYGTNVFYGHLHDVQGYSKTWVGDHKTVVGQSLGCLCKYRQNYLKGRPTKWQQAFGVFYFRSDGYFHYYVPRVFRNSFAGPDGRLWRG